MTTHFVFLFICLSIYFVLSLLSLPILVCPSDMILDFLSRKEGSREELGIGTRVGVIGLGLGLGLRLGLGLGLWLGLGIFFPPLVCKLFINVTLFIPPQLTIGKYLT
jgi:hypothetical protein